MIADLKLYPEYKESGLPWLGQVPGHWSFERAKWRFRKRKELNVRGEHTNILSLTLRGVVNNNPDNPEGLVPKDYRTYQFFAKGDLVFKLIDLENLRTSRVGLVHEDGIMSSAYVRLVPSAPTNIRYFYYQFYDLYSRGIYNQLGAGVRATLGPSDLLNVGIVIPPPDEQAAIVRFLDWANGRLDSAIRAKRKVITLLNEQKQSIIYRAVTRGIDSSFPLSATNRPFLEHLPAHWPVLRAKLLLRQVVPLIPDCAEMVTCFRDGQVTLRRNRRTTGFTNAIWELGYQGIEPGQLVLHSMDAFAGAIGVSDSSGKCSPEYVICEPAVEGVLPEYYGHLLRSLSLRGLFVALCPSVRERAPRVRFSDFGSFVLPKPPMSEQAAIVDYISDSCRSIDTSLAIMRRESDLLGEYKTRLVVDVVTGKLDVREAAAHLPGESLPDIVEMDLDDEINSTDEEADE